MANILILEDNTDLALSWSELLNEAGHWVELLNTADIPLQILKDLEIDLIILDMFFYKQDYLELQGLNFLREYEKIPKQSRPFLLAVSGQNLDISVLDVAKAYGVDLTLQKPILSETLLDSVTQLLHQKKNSYLHNIKKI